MSNNNHFLTCVKSTKHPDLVSAVLQSALDAADPIKSIQNHLRIEYDILYIENRQYHLNVYQRCFVIGAGKAAATLAKGLVEVLKDRIYKGLVVVKTYPRGYRSIPDPN